MNSLIDSSVHLKKSEVCAQLGISPRTLDNLVLRGQFPPGVKIGKWCYWSRCVIAKFHERAFNVQENWSPVQEKRR